MREADSAPTQAIDTVEQPTLAVTSDASPTRRSLADRSWQGTPAGDLAMAEVDPGFYELGPEIGGGGMGRIFHARDLRLGRVLAIKQLRPDLPGLAARFENEARITARLQHPAIVNVHEAGRWLGPRPQAGGVEDPVSVGAPFYAMKLVAGRSLDEEVAAARSPAERRALLPRVIAVAEALAYAHAQGIVHRDLKPHNVMVGEYGETVVIDWGLAKDVKTAGAPPTAAGDIFGTPAYISPEQAAGKPVDARADVYAIGALLYHVLGGQAPYAGGTSDIVVSEVRARPPAPLAELAPGLPADLLAIVHKAMARDPADRYPTAKELAADLRRFHAGQLVGVHDYSTWQLVRRFVRRYRAAAGVLVVMLGVLAATGALSFARIVAERDRAERERAVAETSRREAQGQREAAEGLVDFMVFKLRDRLEPLDRLDLLEGMASSVGEYYRSTVAATAAEGLPDDARRRRAEALHILGTVEVRRGHTDAALQAYRTSIDVSAPLAERSLADAALTAQLWESSAEVSLGQGDQRTGVASFRAAAGVLERAADRLAPPRASAGLEALWRLIGQQALDRDDLRGALIAAGSEYLAVVEGLSDLHPSETRWQDQAASLYEFLGAREVEMGGLDAAIAHYRRAVELSERLAAELPERPEQREYLAETWCRLADAQSMKDDLPAARQASTRCIRTYEQLAAEGRKDAWQDAALGHAWSNLGDIETLDHHPAEALAAYGRFLEIATRLAADIPDDIIWQEALAEAWSKIAHADRLKHSYASARAAQRKALDIQSRLLALDPDNAERPRNLAAAYDELALTQSEEGDPRAALASLHTSVEIRERLLAQKPGSPTIKGDLAETWFRFGLINGMADEPDASRLALRKAIGLHVEAQELRPISNRDAVWLGKAWERLGTAELHLGDREAARDAFRTSLGFLVKIEADEEKEILRARASGGLAEALAPAAEARPLAEQALAIFAEEDRAEPLRREDKAQMARLRRLLSARQ